MKNCPECDAELAVPGDAEAGEIVSCADCGADYELVAAAGGGGGLDLKAAEKVGEDWGE